MKQLTLQKSSDSNQLGEHLIQKMHSLTKDSATKQQQVF